jgi:alpha-ribazole phosphatase/probable phosphoglycerate mutase
MTQSIWLLRHGEPVADARGRCYGSLDVELSAEGIRQAHRAVPVLREYRLTAIYSSTRRRCLDTARILAAEQNVPLETLEALREIDFGDFEGRTYESIAAEFPEIYRQWMECPTKVRFPGGESFDDMWIRVTSAVKTLRARHAFESIAIVTHGGVIRIILAEVLGMPRENIFRIAQRYGAINLIRYFDNVPLVERING